jgi:hypothetical protein
LLLSLFALAALAALVLAALVRAAPLVRSCRSRSSSFPLSFSPSSCFLLRRSAGSLL